MAIELFIEKFPEDLREAFKAELSNYVLAKDALKHPEVNSEFQRQLSLKHQDSIDKWHKEKMPLILADEVKKLNPAKDPKDQAIMDMQTELANMKKQALLKDRKAAALQKLAEIGLPPDLADFAINEDEEIFGSNITKLSGLVTWKDAELKKALTGAVGNQKPPQGGANSTLDFSKMSQTEVMKFAGQGQAEKEAVTKWLATEK